ncbi:hypothetical protein GL297_06590 [Komagataeibacter sp. FXV2]|nr:hypothetical protein [Komagataeibacter sp. FXV2]
MTEQKNPPFTAQTIENAAVPNVYANGFANVTNGMDVTVLWIWNNRPALRLTLNLSAAKSFAKQLSTFIENIEKETNTNILTMEDIVERTKDSSQNEAGKK